MYRCLLIILSSILSGINGQAACEDVDPGACMAMANQNPNMCADAVLSTQVCPKHCDMCALLCYSGPVTLDNSTNLVDVHIANTITCNYGEVCMLSKSRQDSNQYQAKCGLSQDCVLDTKCCMNDLCNTPSILLPVTTTTSTLSSATTSSPKSCGTLDIAYSARVTKNLTLDHAERVVFDSVYTNAGDAYDNTTGTFHCPVSGIYVFEVYTMATLTKHTWLRLFHNNNYILSLYGHKTLNYGSAGNAVILELTKGDEVCLRAMDSSAGVGTNIYGRDSEVYTTFSGYLISPVCDDIPANG